MTPAMILTFIVLSIAGMCLAAVIEQAGTAVVVIVIVLVLSQVLC